MKNLIKKYGWAMIVLSVTSYFSVMTILSLLSHSSSERYIDDMIHTNRIKFEQDSAYNVKSIERMDSLINEYK